MLVRSDGTKVMAISSKGVEVYDPRSGVTIPDGSFDPPANYAQVYDADESTRISMDFVDNSIVLDDDQGHVKRRSTWSFDPATGLITCNRDRSIWAFIDAQARTFTCTTS